jgi:hypothetical protein
MHIFEFIYKLNDSKGLKAINFDEKELVIPSFDESMPAFPISDENGIGVIKIPSKKKLKELADLSYYLVLKDKSSLGKVEALLNNYFLNKVYVLNDGNIIIFISNENQDNIAITDVGLDCEFSISNSLESLVKWFKTPIGIPETKETKDDNELNMAEIDNYINQRVDDDIKKTTDKIQVTQQPTQEFGGKVILVVDRFVKEDNIRKAYSVFKNKEQYEKAAIYNFYTLLDDDGRSYMLECISLVEQMKIESDKKVELYHKMQALCKEWFDKVKSLGVTDICSRRVFQSDRLLTPETVLWLWGYYVIGQKCNWILSDGSMIRVMKNEFQDSDIKNAKFYEGEARKSLSGNRQYIVNLPEQYMAIGCANYLVDIGQSNTTIEWKSDNISFESHIVAGMGNYNRVPNTKTLEEQIDLLVASNRTELYKQFVKVYYGV